MYHYEAKSEALPARRTSAQPSWTPLRFKESGLLLLIPSGSNELATGAIEKHNRSA